MDGAPSCWNGEGRRKRVAGMSFVATSSNSCMQTHKKGWNFKKGLGLMNGLEMSQNGSEFNGSRDENEAHCVLYAMQ